MKKQEPGELICPFCDEGALESKSCPKCGKIFLICDECESLYRDKDSMGEEFSPDKCPYCGAMIH